MPVNNETIEPVEKNTRLQKCATTNKINAFRDDNDIVWSLFGPTDFKIK